MIKYRFSCSADVCPCILTNYGTFISLSAAVSRLPVTETTLLSLFFVPHISELRKHYFGDNTDQRSSDDQIMEQITKTNYSCFYL